MSVHQKGKKNRKLGRSFRKPKKARYESSRRRECNKLKRILQSNGLKEALKYAEEHHLKL
ncbi:hypothetical protein KAR91_10330 [Candidatus Pacearchaeota archaeon]|nr:hypothetical protein [Candidatus Pacearchaeota archaeon]